MPNIKCFLLFIFFFFFLLFVSLILIIILFQTSSILLLLFHASLVIMLKLCSFHNWETTMYNVMYLQIVTLASVSSSLLWTKSLFLFVLVRHCHSLLWVESVDSASAILICCIMMICACAFLLFWHNAQVFMACNYSHIMLSIIDLSLCSQFARGC